LAGLIGPEMNVASSETKVVRTINDFFMESILFVVLGYLTFTKVNHNIRFTEPDSRNFHLEFNRKIKDCFVVNFE
jgi:hypothetical protein